MSLASGAYTIRSAMDANPFIGGQVPKGKIPKDMKIVSLPKGEEKAKKHEWFIEKCGKNEYFLTAKGATSTYVLKDLVYGSLVKREKGPRPEKWNIKRVPQHGKDQYLIMTHTPKEHGWVLPESKENTQIAIRNLTGLQSFPPKFPAKERFIIKSLADLD